MKLASLIDEKYGLSRNLGREFGERYLKDFVDAVKFVELWDKIEDQYKDLQPKLQATFEKTNDLLKYIQPEQGDETYRVASLPEAAAQLLNEYLDDIITATNESLELKNFDYDTAVKIIEHFDGLFQEMLDIFTSNTDTLKQLKPYKQTKIGFRTSQKKESIGFGGNELERDDADTDGINEFFYNELKSWFYKLRRRADYSKMLNAKTDDEKYLWLEKKYIELNGKFAKEIEGRGERLFQKLIDDKVLSGVKNERYDQLNNNGYDNLEMHKLREVIKREIKHLNGN